MPWVRRLAAAIVDALAAAEAQDGSILDGFKRRIIDLLERARPVVAAVPRPLPPPLSWDRPSEKTVILMAKATPGVTYLGVAPAAPPVPAECAACS